MRHARADYERFQDPTGKIPSNEPVFLIRGQDKYAARLLRLYATWVEMDDGDPVLVKQTRLQADRMDAWPTKKSPDL